METMGQRIKKRREDKGWTLRDLEKETDISNAFLSMVENGAQLNVDRLQRIAKALGCKASDLMGERVSL